MEGDRRCSFAQRSLELRLKCFSRYGHFQWLRAAYSCRGIRRRARCARMSLFGFQDSNPFARMAELLSSVFRSVLYYFPPLRSHSLIANASQTLKHALTLSSLTHFLPSQPQLPLHRTVAPRARLGPRRRLRHPSCCTATRGDGRVCWVVC